MIVVGLVELRVFDLGKVHIGMGSAPAEYLGLLSTDLLRLSMRLGAVVAKQNDLNVRQLREKLEKALNLGGIKLFLSERPSEKMGDLLDALLSGGARGLCHPGFEKFDEGFRLESLTKLLPLQDLDSVRSALDEVLKSIKPPVGDDGS